MSAVAATPHSMHREGPVRQCPDCGAYLTTANEDGFCWLHGGWVTQRWLEQQAQDRAQPFEELVAA